MNACRAETPRVFRPNPVRHFSQCCGETLKLAFRTLSMARRFLERLPSRNAARLSSESCAAFQSMPRERTSKLAFRTLSMAQRRIERLQGVQFCRHTTEIRSEVSRPPDLFRTASPRNRKVSSLLLSGFGRAGGYGKRFCAFFVLTPLRFVG